MDLSWVNAILKYSHHSKLTLFLPTEALVRNTLRSQGKLLQSGVKNLKRVGFSWFSSKNN